LSSKSIEEPARLVPIYGEYDVAVPAADPPHCGRRCGGAARRRTLPDRALWLSRRNGHGRQVVTNFCGLHANVPCAASGGAGIATALLARIDKLGGLNAPHLILGKIFAQAY